ncbi:hypothetical protein CYMTET_28285, partial [Cymbomonas tetramitiformis]
VMTEVRTLQTMCTHKDLPPKTVEVVGVKTTAAQNKLFQLKVDVACINAHDGVEDDATEVSDAALDFVSNSSCSVLLMKDGQSSQQKKGRFR